MKVKKWNGKVKYIKSKHKEKRKNIIKENEYKQLGYEQDKQTQRKVPKSRKEVNVNRENLEFQNRKNVMKWWIMKK